MSFDLKELEGRIVVEKMTVTAFVRGNRKGDEDFVSLGIASTTGHFTLEEAHFVHKIVSKEATEMAYMDALARGHKTKAQVAEELPQRRKNYEALIRSLEKRADANS